MSGDGISRACAASLARLGTDHLDLYLLHWPVPSAQFSAWSRRSNNSARQERFAPGVCPTSTWARWRICSAFRTAITCATNQVPYSLKNRRVERDVLPWCTEHNMPVMAYSPLGGDHNLVVGDPRTGADRCLRMGARRAAVALGLGHPQREGHRDP